jgi:hypothetical protein
VTFIVGIIDERAEKNTVLLEQVLEQVIRAYLVAFVGRVGQAMDEIKNVGHRRL